MKYDEKIRFHLYGWWLVLKFFPYKIKRIIWNKHIMVRWQRLWIRKDEFHPSLNMNPKAMVEMSKEEKRRYLEDLCHRRRVAKKRADPESF